MRCLWARLQVAKEVAESLGRCEVLQRQVPEEPQLCKGQFLSCFLGEIEIVSSTFDVLTALRASVKTSPRAAHQMLEAEFVLTAFPALGLHHLWLFFGQRPILKRIHAGPHVMGSG